MTKIPNPPEPLPPISRALEVAIISDEVVFIGPGRAAFSMTREAAVETHKHLSQALGLA